MLELISWRKNWLKLGVLLIVLWYECVKLFSCEFNIEEEIRCSCKKIFWDNEDNNFVKSWVREKKYYLYKVGNLWKKWGEGEWDKRWL